MPLLLLDAAVVSTDTRGGQPMRTARAADHWKADVTRAFCSTPCRRAEPAAADLVHAESDEPEVGDPTVVPPVAAG
ncbi:hypothetical protein ACWDZ8_09735, partial [Streptomyces sp. NPDC003233]